MLVQILYQSVEKKKSIHRKVSKVNQKGKNDNRWGCRVMNRRYEQGNKESFNPEYVVVRLFH